MIYSYHTLITIGSLRRPAFDGTKGVRLIEKFFFGVDVSCVKLQLSSSVMDTVMQVRDRCPVVRCSYL